LILFDGGVLGAAGMAVILSYLVHIAVILIWILRLLWVSAQRARATVHVVSCLGFGGARYLGRGVAEIAHWLLVASWWKVEVGGTEMLYILCFIFHLSTILLIL
jgi:hypothetical protein